MWKKVRENNVLGLLERISIGFKDLHKHSLMI